MGQRCAVISGQDKCGSQNHTVIRPTKGGPGAVICYEHQQGLRRGERLFSRRGEFFLPLASRTRARIMRGG